MTVDLSNVTYQIYASLKVFRPQAIPGTLYLLSDRIYFEYRAITKGQEIKNTFYFKNIKSVKSGFSVNPFRIVITENEGEQWIFDQVPRKEAKEFVRL